MDETNKIRSIIQINRNFTITIESQLFFDKITKTNEYKQLNNNLTLIFIRIIRFNNFGNIRGTTLPIIKDLFIQVRKIKCVETCRIGKIKEQSNFIFRLFLWRNSVLLVRRIYSLK